MRISEAELALLEVLWDNSPLAAAEIAECVGAQRRWSLQTVKTMLVRLEKKGAISHDAVGRRHLYTPCISKEGFVARESDRLVDRLFGGRAAPLLAQLAEREKLSPEDIAEIHAVLDRIAK